MARKKRAFTTFSLSFLDVMSCGFGAVILVFLVIDHSIKTESDELNRDLLSEVSMLEEDVRDGQAGLVKLRNILSDVDQRSVEAQGQATRITEDIDKYEAMIVALKKDGFTERTDIEALKAEIRALEEEVKKLRQSAQKDSGNSARTFVGEGNRQYLTGLKLGGNNIAILLDISSSMLADKLVNIIRLRNMDPATQRKADKWNRAMATVDWLTAQLPAGSKFQVITFNTKAVPALENTAGRWLDVADQAQLDQLSAQLRNIIPSGGTSLENAFTALQQLSPVTDNIFLITDGLPTQGAGPPRGTKVSGDERQRLYREAVRKLPRNVPVNIILLPMEGDPLAASEFWQLAVVSRGSFMAPSKDWP